MKILATQQQLAPLPNIQVGYMKHYFFYAFLSLLLASCGGGGGGGGSSSSSSGAKPCKVVNGKGELNGTACAVTSCDAGYDNDANQAQCGKTPTGFYSLAKDKTRKTCPTPTNSSSTGRSGLSSLNDCWNCNSGFLKTHGGQGLVISPLKESMFMFRGANKVAAMSTVLRREGLKDFWIILEVWQSQPLVIFPVSRVM